MATRFLKISSNVNMILKSKLITAPSYMIVFNFSFPFSIDVDNNKNQDSSEDSGRKIKKKKKRRHTSDSDEPDHLARKKKKKEKRKRENKKGKADQEDDTRKQLQKIVLQRLENGDKDPKLIEMAMQLMGSDKVKQAPVRYFFFQIALVFLNI